MAQSKRGRYVYCYECGSRGEKNGICKICGHQDNPLLPGIVPNVVGIEQPAAIALITGPEAQLIVGNVTTENSETVAIGLIISSNPAAGTELSIGSPVDIVTSLGPSA